MKKYITYIIVIAAVVLISLLGFLYFTKNKNFFLPLDEVMKKYNEEITNIYQEKDITKFYIIKEKCELFITLQGRKNINSIIVEMIFHNTYIDNLDDLKKEFIDINSCNIFAIEFIIDAIKDIKNKRSLVKIFKNGMQSIVQENNWSSKLQRKKVNITRDENTTTITIN